MKSKSFHISDILSIAIHRAVGNRHMDGIYEIMKHLIGRPVFTNELHVFWPYCEQECRRQLSWLSEVPSLTEEDEAELRAFVQKMEQKHGSTHTLVASVNHIL